SARTDKTGVIHSPALSTGRERSRAAAARAGHAAGHADFVRAQTRPGPTPEWKSQGMSKTIAEKLLIKPHSTVWLNQPARLPLLTPMPEGVRETGTLATAGTAVLFA